MIFMGYYRYLNAYPSNNPNLNPTYIMYIYIYCRHAYMHMSIYICIFQTISYIWGMNNLIVKDSYSGMAMANPVQMGNPTCFSSQLPSSTPTLQKFRCVCDVARRFWKSCSSYLRLETPKGAYLTMGCTIWIIFGCVPVMTMVVLHENSKQYRNKRIINMGCFTWRIQLTFGCVSKLEYHFQDHRQLVSVF